MSYHHMDHCLACGQKNLKTYLDLGAQPLANSFHDGSKEQTNFPLGIAYCGDCFHSQLTHAVSPELLFKHYVYVSGTTSTLRDYFADFVLKCEQDQPGKSLEVLDIASNDGSLLKQFKLRHHDVLGVDPAENLRPHSVANGIETVVAYWNERTAKLINRKFDVIVAMNVLAHNSDPAGFLEACHIALKPNGLIYLQTSQAEMLKRGEFDTIYHEHHSFFTARSFEALLKRTGWQWLDLSIAPVHGGSYLLTVGAKGGASQSVKHRLATEEKDGFYSPSTYAKFASNAIAIAEATRNTLKKLQSQKFRLFAYGAAAKGNTFLNFSSITELEALLDDNPLKQGLRAPGSNIPVKPTATINDIAEPVAILILAWNFFDELILKLKKVRNHPDDVVMTYFPEFRIMRLSDQ